MDSTAPTIVWLTCRSCNSNTRHAVLFGAQDENEDGYLASYDVVQCQGCQALGFRLITEYLFNDDETTQTLYPPRLLGRPMLSAIFYLPEQIRKVYLETHAALCSNLPLLAALGMRTLVEAVCKNQGTQGRTLEARIDELVTLGVLGKPGAATLHELRSMGNAAAHEVREEKMETLGNAMEVVEHLLQGVYVFPARRRLDESRKRSAVGALEPPRFPGPTPTLTEENEQEE